MTDKPSCVAIVGLKDFHGRKPFHPGMPLVLVKEPEHPLDAEMIVAMTDVGPVGVVANSAEQVPLGCASAGRIYDTFPDAGLAIVRFVMDNTVIAEIMTGENGQDVPRFVYVGVRMLDSGVSEQGRGRR